MIAWLNKHLFIFLLPLVVLFLFYVGISEENFRMACNRPAEGTVIQVISDRRLVKNHGKNGSSWKTVYIATIVYEAEGKRYTKEAEFTLHPIWSVGDRMTIYYHPQKPHHFVSAEQYQKNLSLYRNHEKMIRNIFFIVIWISSVAAGIFLDKKRYIKKLVKVNAPSLTPEEKKKRKKLLIKQIAVSVLFISIFKCFITVANMAGKHSDLLLVAWFLFPFGLILIGMPILIIRTEKKEKRRCNLCAKGRVIQKKLQKERRHAGKNYIIYQYLIVEYYDNQGNQYKISSDGGFPLPEGEMFIDVWYNPADPKDAYIKGHYCFVWKVFGIFAIMVIAICGGIFAITLNRIDLFFVCLVTAILAISVPVLMTLKK